MYILLGYSPRASHPLGNQTNPKKNCEEEEEEEDDDDDDDDDKRNKRRRKKGVIRVLSLVAAEPSTVFTDFCPTNPFGRATSLQFQLQ